METGTFGTNKSSRWIGSRKPKMSERFLIIFSGLDGAGKSTQIERLTAYLQNCNRRPLYIWSRGGYTPGFERLKKLARRTPGKSLPPPGRTAQRERTFHNPKVRRLWLGLALADLILLVRRHRSLGPSPRQGRSMRSLSIGYLDRFPLELSPRDRRKMAALAYPGEGCAAALLPVHVPGARRRIDPALYSEK